MARDESGIFTVFGGTGFLGRRIVRHFAARNVTVRVVSRHPEGGKAAFPDLAHLEFVAADINDESALDAALAGATGVVNAVSLYVERKDQTFHSVHVEAASRLARRAREAGVSRLIHISGIGADRHSSSLYIRSRGEGEEAVRRAFPGATIVRPTVMFGLDDAFLTPLVGLVRKLPVLPLFGDGRTALQPVHVEDVGEAVSRILDETEVAETYEFAGPHVYSYGELLGSIGEYVGKRPILFPLPFSIWKALAFGMEMLPHPLVTRNQVELMMIDNVASGTLPGLKELNVEPRGIAAGLPEVIGVSK